MAMIIYYELTDRENLQVHFIAGLGHFIAWASISSYKGLTMIYIHESELSNTLY